MVNDKTAKLALLFVLAAILFNYPVLGLAGQDSRVGGMPVLYVYLFVAWLLIIVVTAWLVSQPTARPSGKRGQEDIKDEN
jgi:hypothetical protein